MKTLLAITAATLLALAASGTALAGGRPSQHPQPQNMGHDRYDRTDRHDDYRDRCEPCHDYCWWYPSYQYPCYEYPCYQYPCYDYPPCDPDRDYRPYKGDRGRTPVEHPLRGKTK